MRAQVRFTTAFYDFITAGANFSHYASRCVRFADCASSPYIPMAKHGLISVLHMWKKAPGALNAGGYPVEDSRAAGFLWRFNE
jgi:hypothetical protein